MTRPRTRAEFFVNNFAWEHTKDAKILIVLRQAQRLQWFWVKTKARRPKVSVVRERTGSSRPATRKIAARDKIRLLIADWPDVSLLDLRMPELNGVGVIREVCDPDDSARGIVHTIYGHLLGPREGTQL